MLLERSDRDRKYAEEIGKKRQPLNAQKTFLENVLGNFKSFTDLERDFKGWNGNSRRRSSIGATKSRDAADSLRWRSSRTAKLLWLGI